MIKAYFLVILEHITERWTLYIVAKKKPEESTTLGTPVRELNNLEDQYILGAIEEALNLIEEKRGKLISVTQVNSVGKIHKTGEKIVEKYLLIVRAYPESD